MTKRMLTAVLTVALTLSLTACGGKQKTQQDAAADGDTVNINYTGSVDGVAFTGGSAENYDLTLGSNTFIDGFEEQIVGHKPGETFDVNVTFPDGYSDSTDASGNTVKLSGQKAVFTVVLNYISESVLPELTDAWVASNFGSSNNLYTAEALRAYYQEQLYTSNLNTAVMDDLMANSTFKSIPQQVMDYQVNQCLNYYSTLAGYWATRAPTICWPISRAVWKTTPRKLCSIRPWLSLWTSPPRRSSWTPTPIIRTPTVRTTAPWWP